MKSIKLTIEYTSGRKLDQIVNYVHFANGAIYYQIKEQVSFIAPSSVEPVRIPLENIKSFDITETDQKFN